MKERFKRFKAKDKFTSLLIELSYKDPFILTKMSPEDDLLTGYKYFPSVKGSISSLEVMGEDKISFIVSGLSPKLC